MAFITWVRRSENRHIAEIILQRQEVLNAFNTQMATEFIKICEDIVQAGDIRVVGIRSSNVKSFCTGADLKERNGMSEEEWHTQHRLFEKMFYTLADLQIPSIAIIDGFCLAGGMELALNCDMWVVSDRAVFGLPEVTRGIMPGGGGTRLLARRVGVHHAKEIIFSGGKFSGKKVAEMGLVNRLAVPEGLDDAFLELAMPICANAPLAVSYCKASIDELVGYPDMISREKEIAWYNKCVNTDDRHEGIRAFNEKRAPQFQGR